MRFKIRLTGTLPAIQHNGRLANPLDPHTRQLKALTAKTRKTDDDHLDIMMVEARAACYETPEGLLGIPNANVYACFHEAAKQFKKGTAIERALIMTEDVMPVFIDDDTPSCDVWIKEGHIDYRTTVVSGRRVPRARPILPVGWTSVHEFKLRTNVVDPHALGPIFEQAGTDVGLFEMRPRYGTFVVEVLETREDD